MFSRWVEERNARDVLARWVDRFTPDVGGEMSQSYSFATSVLQKSRYTSTELGRAAGDLTAKICGVVEDTRTHFIDAIRGFHKRALGSCM